MGTAFLKKNFIAFGDMVYYGPEGWDTPHRDRHFVARFKYRGPLTKARLIKVLVNQYTTEEYFKRLDEGETPAGVLMKDEILVFDLDSRKFILNGKVL
jgi:hypothetical protein